MAKRKIPKSWAEEIADLDDPAPRDFDPEEYAEDAAENAEGSSISSDDESQNDARNHYEDVGRSKLRKSAVANLGPQYKGLSISRDDLLTTEVGSDNQFGSDFSDGNVSSEDKFAGMDEGLSKKEEEEKDNNEFTGLDEGSKVQGEDDDEGSSSHEGFGNESEQGEDIFSITHGTNGENHNGQRDDISDSDEDGSEMEESDNISGVGGNASMSSSSNSDKFSPSVLSDRAALRQMMAESQKSVIATISAATKADLAKGKAIKQQQSAFDALLNTRIRLQKAIIASNSFLHSSTVDNSTPLETVHAAESAALKLWTQLDRLRQSLHPPANLKSKKRPFSATLSTSTAELWTRMQTQDSISTAHNRTILDKWSSRLNPPAQLRSSLVTNRSSHLTLPTLLDQYLSSQNTTRLIARTRVPRSCAPLQASTRHHYSDANIYDDADFYTLLLRDFVDRRMADPAASSHSLTTAPTAPSSSITSMPDLKGIKRMRRANVDTKASKGRKMRYTVHEKLRDFMVHEDRGTWGERRVEELFGSLLGRQRKVELREGSEEEDDRREEKSLMLFRR